ncbi:MAG: TonB-dependent receptor [Candidatus Omnitrophota bacterium]|jgi:iron complex outermembrane receptor protein
MARKILILILVSALFCAAGTIFAEEDRTVDLGDIVVATSRFEERALDYPGNVTVITREDIERSNAKYVHELLRSEPGVFVKDFTHVGRNVAVDMRGWGDTASRNVLVLIDGRRINEIDISGTDWTQVPLEIVERIEVIRGAGSVMYGDNAAAGVINIITNKGKGASTIKLGTEFGSYRYKNYYANIQGGHDFTSWNFFYGQNRTDGYRLNGDYEGYDFSGNMTIFPNDNINVNFSGGYHKDWYGMPAGLQRWEIDTLGRRGSTTPHDRAKTETTFLRIVPEFSFPLYGAEHTITVDAWGRKRRTNSKTNFFFFGWVESWNASQIDSVGGSVKYLASKDFGRIQNKLTAGVDLFHAENRILNTTPAWMTYNQLRIKKDTAGVYVLDRMDISGKVVINAGFREEWALYIFDQWAGNDRYVIKEPKQEAFDAGAEFKYAENGAIYGRFARSYRFPSTDEFYSQWTGLNTDLKHQIVDTWELGIKEHSLRYFTADANVFFMDIENEIFYDPTQGAGFGDNGNYDRTQRKGLELSIKSRADKYAELFFNYTYINAYFVGSAFAGNAVPMVPNNKINWGFSLTPAEWLEINFYTDYVGKQFPLNDQMNIQAKNKDYFVCNGKVTLKYMGWDVFFGINNMFDETYAEVAVANVAGTVVDLHPAPKRNYVFGASWKF